MGRIFYNGNPYSGNASHNYSTDEQIVGTWIDGSPVYEKSYYFDSNIAGIHQHNISNFGALISFNGTFTRQDGYRCPIPIVPLVSGWNLAIDEFDNTSFDIKIGTAYSGTYAITDVILTIRYTKTST